MQRKNRLDVNQADYSSKINEAIRFVHQDVGFFAKFKVERLLDITSRLLGDPSKLKFLDVGCGVGLTDSFLAGRTGELHGVDISVKALNSARRGNPGVAYSHYDGNVLPFSDHQFDVTFAICVFHHVPPVQWGQFTSEMRRVTAPGGLCIAFEHNPLNPLTRHAVGNCEFDNDAVLLTAPKLKNLISGAGLQIAERKFIHFFPFSFPGLVIAEKGLGWLPLGAQYYVAGRKMS